MFGFYFHSKWKVLAINIWKLVHLKREGEKVGKWIGGKGHTGGGKIAGSDSNGPEMMTPVLRPGQGALGGGGFLEKKWLGLDGWIRRLRKNESKLVSSSVA